MTTNDDLIAAAAATLRPHVVGDRLFGNVAAALVTDQGTQFQGVFIDIGSGAGHCAEHAAITAMVTAGEYRIVKIVAVWRDDHEVLYALQRCGRCWEFIRQGDPDDIDIEVVLAGDRSATLRQLLPRTYGPSPSGR